MVFHVGAQVVKSGVASILPQPGLRNYISTKRNIVSAELTNLCWVISNGTPGMENQALGLAERINLPIAVKRVRLTWPWSQIAPFSPGAPFGRQTPDSDVLAPPWPRLAIGVGRQSIPFMRAIKHASPATITVQCQDPRTDLSQFDLVVPPEHDGLTGLNVFPILGSPHRITPEKLAEATVHFAPRFEKLCAPRLAVLIGGKNRAYDFGTETVQRLTSTLADLSRNFGLMVSTSRRTGLANTTLIESALAGTGADLWKGGGGENPYLGVLAWADAFLITADSVNMASEAAATGKPVHIFTLPCRSTKFDSFHHALAARGISRVFDGHIGDWTYVPLDETGRAAKRVRELLDVSATAPDMSVQGR
jgi:mitochondrial fission protein ELM1